MYWAIMWPLSTPGSCGQERVEPVVAGDVQESVGAALADAGQIGDDDGQEVEHVGHRRAVEVAVGLHPPVQRHDGIVDDTGQFALGDHAGVGGGVPGRAGDLGRAAQRVGVLDHARSRESWWLATIAESASSAVMFARRRCLSGMRPQPLQVVGEHPVGAQLALDAHGRGDVGHPEQVVQVGQGEHQLAEHAVGAVDQRQALLLGEGDRRQTVRAQRVGRCPAVRRRGSRTWPSPITASATCASGARSPEQPRLPYS